MWCVVDTMPTNLIPAIHAHEHRPRPPTHNTTLPQVTDSTDVLIRAAQAAPEEEDEPGGGGCLKGVLRLKGVGFVEFGEVERALRKVCMYICWWVCVCGVLGPVSLSNRQRIDSTRP